MFMQPCAYLFGAELAIIKQNVYAIIPYGIYKALGRYATIIVPSEEF